MTRYLRQTGDGEEQRATTLELFFDLVFVFAITQLSHSLVEHLDAEGAAKTLFLLLVVWWAWIYTTWMTNWFDPESPVVRSILIAVMLASLLMAIAIPEAFGDRALLFAASYAAPADRPECLRGLRQPRGLAVTADADADSDLVDRSRRALGASAAFWAARR